MNYLISSAVIFVVLCAHNVKGDEIEIVIRDQNKMEIDSTDLAFLMDKFRGCSHFHIEIVPTNMDNPFPSEIKEVSRFTESIVMYG